MMKLKLQTEVSIYNNFDDLDPDLKRVILAAENATNSSYSPYSKFTVGAALLLDDNNITTGSNQENAAYPSGLCAERVALFSYGHKFKDQKIKVIGIAAKHSNDTIFGDCTPCGGCRQVMLEYERKQKYPIKVIFRFESVFYVLDTVEALVPLGFML